MAGKLTPRDGDAVADTWVSPVPASVTPAAPGGVADARAALGEHSAARFIGEPSVRVLRVAGEGAPHDPDVDEPDAPASTTFEIGARVDARYLVRRFIGRGGMGEVYEAHDELMDRRVALKTILRSVADRSRAARRFKAEVRNAQRVAHGHVCRIHDLHEHHDGAGAPLPFFSMELIDGERLAQRLQSAPLTLADARRIAHQLLGGLAAAHARGVLHLDFKSDNVLLRRSKSEPDAVIMDFGLSRVLGDANGSSASERRQLAGTLPYMSIEQLECRDSLGPASDVYAFGVVLYEMLTRTLPFEGDSLGALLMKQLNERPIAPSRRVPTLAPALDRFVLRCLQREPRARFADAGAALSALEQIGDFGRPLAALSRSRLWPAAALLLASGALLSARVRGPALATEQAAQQELVERREPLAPTPALAAPSSAPTPASAMGSASAAAFVAAPPVGVNAQGVARATLEKRAHASSVPVSAPDLAVASPRAATEVDAARPALAPVTSAASASTAFDSDTAASLRALPAAASTALVPATAERAEPLADSQPSVDEALTQPLPPPMARTPWKPMRVPKRLEH